MSRSGWEEDSLDAGESEMGPGVDLIVSMFAMVLLVLVVVVHQRDDFATKVEDPSRWPTEVRRLAGELDRTRRDLGAKVSELAAEKEHIARLNSLLSATASGKSDAEKTRAKAEQDLVEERRRFAELQHAMNARGEGNTPVIRLEAGKSSLFGINEVSLLPAAREQIRRGLPALLRAARDRQANQIAVFGASSPEPRPAASNVARSADAADSNIDLSATRALAVAHFLASLGVPYRCMVASGLGTTRTALNPNLDRAPAGTSGLYVDERRVDLFAEFDPASTCPTEKLEHALQQATSPTGQISGLSRNGWPIVGDVEVPIRGILALNPTVAKFLVDAFRGKQVNCSSQDGLTFDCAATDTGAGGAIFGVAQTVLCNGGARLAPDAPPELQTYYQGADACPRP
jgi:flagellar motor protein MotB